MAFRPLTIALVLLLTIPAASGEQTRTPLTVTYVANEGFIIACQDKKVVIDALFGGWESNDYRMPSDSTIALMKAAQPPFDSVDVLAVTHVHDDHFSPTIVASHMRHDLGCTLVCTPQVVEKLAGIEGYSEFSSRIRPVCGPVDSAITISISGLEITVIVGQHGAYYETDEKTGKSVNLHAGVQHLEYLISMCGRTVYHSGDAPLNDTERYRRLGFGQSTIDLALVQRFSPREVMSFGEKLIWDVIRPEKVILMHMRPGQDYAEPENKKVCADRGIIVPRVSLETWTVP
jgi:L-ascorbate metabolism protein UlaG (beta-lactamase superfamily)